jgi:hypothetical protein
VSFNRIEGLDVIPRCHRHLFIFLFPNMCRQNFGSSHQEEDPATEHTILPDESVPQH